MAGTRQHLHSSPLSPHSAVSSYELPMSGPSRYGSPSRKRARMDDVESSTRRVLIACRACRDRKTRCSGEQPACSYCRKSGIACSYLQGTAASAVIGSASIINNEDWASRVISAVDHLDVKLGSALKELQTEQASTYELLRQQIGSSSGLAEEHRSLNGPGLTITGTVPWSTSPQEQTSQSRAARPKHAGLDSGIPTLGATTVISWPLFFRSTTSEFSADGGTAPSFEREYMSRRKNEPAGNVSGSIAMADLVALRNAFVKVILPSLPVLHVADIDKCIRDIGENGADWSAQSCLVFLVSALGALNLDTSKPSEQSLAEKSSRRHIASLYWNMAKKRLSWATEEDDILSAQCSLLAGVWYLCNHEPFKACKMFQNGLVSLAAGHGQIMSRSFHGSGEAYTKCLTIATFWATLQSHCQLRDEVNLGVPDPIKLLSMTEGGVMLLRGYVEQPAETESLSNYQIADISLFNILQNIRRSHIILCRNLSWQEFVPIVSEIHQHQKSLDFWLLELPPSIQFPRPSLSANLPDSDFAPTFETNRLVRAYLEAGELALRPCLYIFLCTSTFTEPHDTDFEHLMVASLRKECAKLVSAHNNFVVARLNNELMCLDSMWNSHRTYVTIRDCFTLSLFLIAAKQAKYSEFPEIELHEGWQEALYKAIALLSSGSFGTDAVRFAQVLQQYEREGW